MHIRKAEPTDEPFLVECARMACTLEGRPLPDADDAAVLSMLPTRSDVALIATEDNGRSLGASWCHVHDPPLLRGPGNTPLPEVAMAVEVASRRRGVGTALLDALVTEAAADFGSLTLNVHLANPAIRLYMRTGFDVAGKGRGRFGVAMIRGSVSASDSTRAGLLAAVREALPDVPLMWAAHIRAIGSSQEAGVRPDEPIVAASVFKVAVALEFYRQVSAGELDPSEFVTTNAIGRTRGPTGLSLFADTAVVSLRDLATSMMVVSDNAATDVILERVTLDRVNQTLRGVGATNTFIAHDVRGLVSMMAAEAGVESWEDVLRDDPYYERLQTSRALQPHATTRTTARDMTTLLHAIWTDTAGPTDACRNVRHAMSLQSGGRLASGLPGARVFAKSGSLLGVVRNEVGVAEFPNGGTYALAIFTRTPHTDFAAGPQIDRAIGDVAGLLVDEVLQADAPH